MKIEEIIAQASKLRDEAKAIVAESKTEVPHIVNAAGHLNQVVTNLQGYLTAVENATKAAAAKTAAPAK